MSHCEIQGIKFDDSDVVEPDEYIPAGEYNPHNVRPWLLHDHGFVVCVVFADCLQDALDAAVDADRMDRFSPDDDWRTECEAMGDDNPLAYLGNACEPFDIETLGFVEIPNPPFSFCALINAAATS